MTPNWRAQPATAAAPRLAGFTTGYARMVHGILLARVPHGEVDDLVQDVFLAALRQLSALRDDGAFGGWLGMIARNPSARAKNDPPVLSKNDPGGL
jgi:DNA-directed RNA polymerase specialized sigma24 family protein